jgi:hypothetical protein
MTIFQNYEITSKMKADSCKSLIYMVSGKQPKQAKGHF